MRASWETQMAQSLKIFCHRWQFIFHKLKKKFCRSLYADRHLVSTVRFMVNATSVTPGVETLHGVFNQIKHDQIMLNFYWPGIFEDVKRFCASCDICQRTVHKGGLKHAPYRECWSYTLHSKRLLSISLGPYDLSLNEGIVAFSHLWIFIYNISLLVTYR